MRKKYLILLSLPILCYFLFALYLIHANDSDVRSIYAMRTEWITQHQSEIAEIFETVFPLAQQCSDLTSHNTESQSYCTQQTRILLDAKFSTLLTLPNSTDSRIAAFFIRLKDTNTIEKLYQSGNYRLESADTSSEKMIVSMLQSKLDPLDYPQYNCCGGDDIIPKLPIVGYFLPPRVYLHDFPTEIEMIHPILGNNQQILGAIVDLYGD